MTKRYAFLLPGLLACCLALAAGPSPVSAHPWALRRVQAVISSTATGGSWSAPATWVGGVVPTAADNVTIVAGATVTLDVAAAAAALTINAGGRLATSATTAFALQVGGSLINNGTLSLSASPTLGSDLRFVGTGSASFGGTGSTDLFSMSLAKAALADVVDMNLPALTVKTVAAASTGFLLTRNAANTTDDVVGTLRISGTASIVSRVFGSAVSYIVPATGAFWLSNPNFTVAGQNGTPTVNGQLRISAGTAIGSTLYFGGAVAQTLSGSGTFTTLRALTVDNASAGGVTLGVPLVVYRVNLFAGNPNGTSNLTIGDGSLTAFAVQIGFAGNANTSGSLTSAPSFNIRAGSYSVNYQQEATNRTSGFEIPATRAIDAVTIANTNGVTLAGGNLTVNPSSGSTTGTLALTAGLLTTSAANTVIIGGGATSFPTGSASSYVRGPLGITVNSTTAVSRAFAVGDAAGWRPVVVAGIATSGPQTFMATVVNGTTGSASAGLNPTRYVQLQNSASLPPTARVQLSYGPDDVLGNAATGNAVLTLPAGLPIGVYLVRAGAQTCRLAAE
jgi:hypothetical protein